MRFRFLLPVTLVLGLLVAAAPAARAATDDAQVTVVHGIPGVTVDVYVNGDLLLPGFEPRTITDEVALPAGAYEIVVVPAGTDPADAANRVIESKARLEGGSNVSLVAHLDDLGFPTLTAFGNDVREAGRFRSRVAVRHAAFAPAVDAFLFRQIFRRWWLPIAWVTELESGGQAVLEAFAGRYAAAIAPADTFDPVLGPALLDVRRGRFYGLYAIGPNEKGEYELLVQVLRLR